MLSLFITLHTLTLTTVERLRRDERGATAVEYALVLGGVAAVIVAAMAMFGPKMAALFTGMLP